MASLSSDNSIKKGSTWVTPIVFRESAYGECELYGAHKAQVNFTPQFNRIFADTHPPKTILLKVSFLLLALFPFVASLKLAWLIGWLDQLIFIMTYPDN